MNQNKRPKLVGADGDSAAGNWNCFSIKEQDAKSEDEEESRSQDDSSASTPNIRQWQRSRSANFCRDKPSPSSSSMAMLPTEVNFAALPRVLTQITDDEDSFSSVDPFVTSHVFKTSDSNGLDDRHPITKDTSLSTISACSACISPTDSCDPKTAPNLFASIMVSDTEVTATWKLQPGANSPEDIIRWIRQTYPAAVRCNKKQTPWEEDSIHNDDHQGESHLKDSDSSNWEPFDESDIDERFGGLPLF